MTNTEIPAGRVWTDSPLYLFMVNIFPGHLTDRNALDVRKLKADLGKSHERVYQWLRTSRLTPANAMAVCKLANSEKNVAALTEAGRNPPEIRDFDRFVYADD